MAQKGTLLDLIEPRGLWEDRKTAFVFWDGEAMPNYLRTLSYASLRSKAEKFASALLEIGVRPGDRLAIMLPNMLQFPVVCFGAWIVGAIAVPINPLYAKTPNEILKILKDSGAKVIVALDRFYPAIKSVENETELQHIILTTPADSLPFLKKLIYWAKVWWKGEYFYYPDREKPNVKSYANLLFDGRRRKLKPVARPNDLALILYTSGTTGDPKGVMHAHESLLANAYACKKLVLELGLEEGKEVFLAAAPHFHIMGIAAMFNTALLMRAKVILFPINPNDPNAYKKMLKAIQYTRATGFVGVPGWFNAMAGLLSRKDNSYDISSLELCISGTAPLDHAVKSQFESLSGKEIKEGFGLTEAGITHCQRTGDEVGSVGAPLDGIEQKIIDIDEDGVGELCVRSPGNMRGYWNLPEKTREVLDSENWLRTGDLTQIDNCGNAIILGRADIDFVKGTRGEKIPLGPLENLLMTHSQVMETAAIGSPADTKRGYKISALVVLRDKKMSCGEMIKEQLFKLCEALPRAQKPDEIDCIEKIPRSPMGKVLKKDLRLR